MLVARHSPAYVVEDTLRALRVANGSKFNDRFFHTNLWFGLFETGRGVAATGSSKLRVKNPQHIPGDRLLCIGHIHPRIVLLMV